MDKTEIVFLKPPRQNVLTKIYIIEGTGVNSGYSEEGGQVE